MGTRRRGCIALVAGQLIVACTARATGLFGDFEAGVVHDDNLGRAERARDREEELGLEGYARAGRSFVLREDTTITVAGSLRALEYREFGDLAEVAPGITLSGRRKFGLGAEAPWLALALGTERIESRSRIRDGWQHGVTLSGGRRLGERLNLLGALRYQQREGDEDTQRDDRPPVVPAPPPSGVTRGDVFDQRNQELELGFDYLFSESLLLLASWRLREGDIVSTTVPYDRILSEAEAFTQDHAFGNETFAYRLEARTQVFSIALNRALGDRSAVDLGWEYQRSESDGGIEYARSQTRLRFLYSW